METAVTITNHEENDVKTMVQAVKNRLAAVRELLASELQGPTKDNPDGRDYGVIPGTKKLTLLLPGAEKIALMFQFVPSYSMDRRDLPGGHRECTALCTLSHGASGRMVGSCSASASTMEAKHRYRGASGKPCPECGTMACRASKKEYGGGYWCDGKAGGCGKKFKPGSAECKILDEMPTTRQENPDPADQWNTVEKIAQKRAYVGAVKNASAASEVFTVDMEAAEAGEPESRPPVEMPKPKAPEAPKESTQQPQGELISEAQGKRLFALAHKAGVSVETLRDYLQGLGIEHTKDIKKSEYEDICAWVQAGGQLPE